MKFKNNYVKIVNKEAWIRLTFSNNTPGKNFNMYKRYVLSVSLISYIK